VAVVSHWVWTCDGGTRSQASSLGDAVNTNHPTCTSGQGTWTQLTYDDGSAFDPSTLTVSNLASAYSTGLVVMGIPLMIVISIKVIIRMVKEAW
jgi:hypothetical protein